VWAGCGGERLEAFQPEPVEVVRASESAALQVGVGDGQPGHVGAAERGHPRLPNRPRRPVLPAWPACQQFILVELVEPSIRVQPLE
jgi:hypothetical protein